MHIENDTLDGVERFIATYRRTLALWGVKPHPIRTFFRTLLGA